MSTWPDGRTSAVTFSFDFDAEELMIGEDPANAFRPGVLSQASYGPNVGVPLILRLLRTYGVTATFFVSGKDALRHPDTVRSILADGHEIAHHGHSHRSPSDLSREEERTELHDGLAALRTFGCDVVGYRSPSWELTPHTMDLLEEAGFMYSSNLLDHFVPYLHEDRTLIEIPVSWILDDAPHFWFTNDTWDKTIRSPQEALDVWLPEIEGISRLGGHAMLTFHPFLTGRPSRLPFLERLLQSATASDAWVASSREVAEHIRLNGSPGLM